MLTQTPIRQNLTGISDKDVRFYHENGFLVVRDAVNKNEVETLRQETIRICRGELGGVKGLPVSSEQETDDEVIRKTLCVHFPHKISELAYDFMTHETIIDVLTKAIGPNVKCMQSMLFIKSAGKPGQAWHQDEDFIPTRDRSLTGAWMALDDATIENGCLWVIPGSHRHGILWELEEQDNPDFDCTNESVGFPYSDEDAIPVEIEAGSIVFFNGYLLHRSLPNVTTVGYRRALVNHYMSAESLLPWGKPEEDDDIGTFDHRDIVIVAGTDPYAHKGIKAINSPHVRPSGEGGCKLPAEETGL